MLRASGQVTYEDDPSGEGAGCLFLGELGLDGTLRHTNGILPMVALARDHGIRTVFVPVTDAAEAALAGSHSYTVALFHSAGGCHPARTQ